MPVFLSTILGGLLSLTASFVGRVLVSLGIAAVTYTGLSASLDFLRDQAIAAAFSLPPEVVGMLSVMKVGTCISIITSAMAARLVINGMSGDSFKKFVLK